MATQSEKRPYSSAIREEELKRLVARDFFNGMDTTRSVRNIDFCLSRTVVGARFNLLWAEAKAGTSHDIYESFVQLILTIGRDSALRSEISPAFLGAFDAEKIAFLPYSEILPVLAQNDFNWNVRPSDHNTKEFKQLHELVRETIEREMFLFEYGKDEARLREFIQVNFLHMHGNAGPVQIEVTRNNFVSVFLAWHNKVAPTIKINWEKAKQGGLIEGDFYLADLLSAENDTIRDGLYVLLKADKYEFDRGMDEFLDVEATKTAYFNDGQKAHAQFWKLYRRPPREEFWDYMVERRDLLVPQDVRERKGAFFTPAKWVELSQRYLAEALGENWQDDYVIWDCCAGTGNLLAGLVDKYKIYASTLEDADVAAMKDRVKNGANLLEANCFQFDFLNDHLDSPKIPDTLRDILQDPERRKKLLVYMNPPYKEAANRRTVTGTGRNLAGVSEHNVREKYKGLLGLAQNELFSQFLLRIQKEIDGCKIGSFSTLKVVQSSSWNKFRASFTADLLNLFVVPANTFDNVNGQFPIAFFVWDTSKVRNKDFITSNVYDKEANLLCTKNFYFNKSKVKTLMDWHRSFYDKQGKRIAWIRMLGTDIQNNDGVFITTSPSMNDFREKKISAITCNNLHEVAVYFPVRKIIKKTWLNNQDHYFAPAKTWETDFVFQTDCLAYTLFCASNRVRADENGRNDWIPFTASEVDAAAPFKSHFMTDYLHGRVATAMEMPHNRLGSLEDIAARAYPQEVKRAAEPLVFSEEAQAVFEAGKAVWRYYHSIPGVNVNASLYDIKEYFRGRDEKGNLRHESDDQTFNSLYDVLAEALRNLAAKIEPKVYEHGFLRQ